MFSCFKSTTCLHLGHVCNGKYDCPLVDDEQLCSLSNTLCPLSCSCVLYRLVCKLLLKPLTHKSSSFNILIVQKSMISLNICNLILFSNLLFLQIHSSGVEHICQHKYPEGLLFCDFRMNSVRVIESNCFGILKMLQVLNLAHNHSEMKYESFVNLEELQILNVSHNPLHIVPESLVSSLNKLKMFFLLSTVNSQTGGHFLTHMKGHLLEVSDFCLCCFKQEETKCNKQPQWYESCSDLLPTKALKILFIVLSVLIFISNISIFVFQFVSRNKNPKQYNLSVFFSAGNYILFAFYLVIIWGTDLNNLNVLAIKCQIHKMPICYVAFTSMLWYSLQTSPFLVILCYLRCSVVTHPIRNSVVFNLITLKKLYTLTCVGCFSITIATFSLLLSLNETLPLHVCSPHLNAIKIQNISFSVFILFNACENVTCSLVIIALNIQLIKSLQVSQYFLRGKKFKKGHKDKESSHVYLYIQLFVISVTHMLSWYPLNLSSVAFLFMDRFPTEFMYYVPILSVPVQSLVVPNVLLISALRNL